MKPTLSLNDSRPSSPYSSSSPASSDSGTLVSSYSDSKPPASPSMLEAGYHYGSNNNNGKGSGWARVRARLCGRTGLRRILGLTLFLSLALLVYAHDRGYAFGPSTTQYQDPSTPTTPTHDAPLQEEASSESSDFVQPKPLEFPPLSDELPKPSDYSPFYGGPSKRAIDIASDPLPVTATLRQRLDAWRASPGGRGEVEGEVELGGFMQWNLEECSTIKPQHGSYMLETHSNAWMTFNRSSIHDLREELIQHMEALIDTPTLNDYGEEGHGIVMVAGNADTLQRAVWSIQVMRKRGTVLPVQIFHFPEEAPAEDDPIREQLKELNAELTAVEGQTKDRNARKSYHLKAIAMIQCKYRHVLYLDSDSIPAADPQYMFESPVYKRLGLFTAQDYWKTSAGSPVWALMGIKCRNEWEMEAGQIFIDKKRNMDILLLSKYMLEGHERFYMFSDGDKDIFRWATLSLRKRYGVPGRWVGGGALPRDSATGFCCHTMMQSDAWGAPLFVHYNLLKQIPSGVGLGFTWGQTKQMPLFDTFPATPATARLGEPLERPNDDDRRGLGDIDNDMLADADEYGIARAPAKEMIMRRAARERGAKARYHGGVVSALCIDFDYVDAREPARHDADERRHTEEEQKMKQVMQGWEAAVAVAKENGEDEPPKPPPPGGPVQPDWRQSPFEIVNWDKYDNLRDFESIIYGLGFKAFSAW